MVVKIFCMSHGRQRTARVQMKEFGLFADRGPRKADTLQKRLIGAEGWLPSRP
jgi:hypothetical protein